MKKWIGISIGLLGIVASVLGVLIKRKGHSSVAVIGGADGPTAIFVAGKVNHLFAASVVVIGIILIAAAGFILLAKKKKD